MSNGNQVQALLQMLAQQQGQQPAQQMSQQGQFNPADIQAGLQGGGSSPFSFAPVPGGIGRNIINALANAGKAATYVAEDPGERRAEDARAQQLYETKQKMALAAGEFGQREKDRAAAAATQKGEFAQREADRATQLDIAKQGRAQEQAKTDETIRHNKVLEGMKDDPADKKLDSYVDDKGIQHVVMQRKDNSTYELTYGKVRPPSSGEAKPQLIVDPTTNKFVEAKPGMDYKPGMQTLQGEGKQQQAIQGAQTDINFANNYIQSKKFDGPHDEALIEKFFDMTKPSSGFRMTQPQIDMALHARSALQGIVAQGKHFLSPNAPYLDDTQRQNIVQTMNDVMSASQSARAPEQAPKANPFAQFGGQVRAPQQP